MLCPCRDTHKVSVTVQFQHPRHVSQFHIRTTTKPPAQVYRWKETGRFARNLFCPEVKSRKK